MNQIEKSVGQRIKEYREKAGVSQEQLAERIGISITSMSNIERGVNYPSFNNFISILRSIDATADHILCDIIPASRDVKVSELNDKLNSLTQEQQDQILTVVDALIKSYKG